MKKLLWIGSSKKDFMKLSQDIRDSAGYALYLAQIGDKHKDAKVLKGFGDADIVEIIVMDNAGAYRIVYMVRLKDLVCVLHVFQKKSKQGIATPKSEIDLIKSRIKQAQEIYKERQKQ